MRPFLAFLIFCVALSTNTAVAAPSDKETIDWLNSKLNGYVCAFRISGNIGQTLISIESFRIEDGVMSYKMSTYTRGIGDTPTVSTVSVQIHDLSSEVGFLSHDELQPPKASVGLKTADGKSSFGFSLDPDLAPRVQKAFQHLLRNNKKPSKEAF